MGEVYRARDTKLKRDVALKVLPEAFASDPERMARFQREAEVLASLNHPNIAQIYGVEERALAMELVDGEAPKGPLPFDDAWKIASQIAAALEYAHDRGIIHRDLKPANIKVTPDGAVKLLDFGLAKAFTSQREPQTSAENSPTLTIRATEVGVILGTAAYMPPEQAKGKSVDKRADIWSFGVVLYELLTGERAFQGEDVSETLVSVIRDQPDLSQVPPKARKLLGRCLEKDPKKRLRDIGEAAFLLEHAPVTALSASRPGRLPWALAGALALALIVASVLLYNATRPASLRPLIRLNAEIAPDTPLARGGSVGANMLALSPDGARLALTLQGADGKIRLYTRLLNQGQVTPLFGTENASTPFFSPEGQWIGFFADGKLKKISVEGGAAVTLCDASGLAGASWGDDGNIIAALSPTDALSRVPSAGGTPVPVTKLNGGEITHRWPQVLPGSQAILFTASTQRGIYDNASVDVISLKTGERKTVARGGFSARYLATSTGTGHLIYLHESTLFAVPFDSSRLAPTGSPAPVLEDVSSTSAAGGDFAFAQNGNFVYLFGKGMRAGWSISWVDSLGKTQPLHAPPRLYFTPRFSPDGKRLAFSMQSGSGEDIWVKDLDRDTPSRLTFLPGTNRWPVWTPDGKNIVFQSTNPSAPGLYWVRSDGSAEAQRLTDGKLNETPYSFSPDGKRLAFYQLGNNSDIFTAPIEGDPGHPTLGKAELFLGTPFVEVDPAFSPDGRWLAYRSNESGTFEVYVRPFPGPGGRRQVSNGGGRFPLWSRDGRELLFENVDQHIMAVGYTANGDSFAAGKPRVWSETRLRDLGIFLNFDLAPDGKRLAAFLADDVGGEKPFTHLTFLLNFFDELRRRVPTAK
jgi:serine/threonine-protein kinase